MEGSSCKIFKGHNAKYNVSCIVILSEQNFATSSYDTTIKIWDYQCSNPIKNITSHRKIINCIIVVPDSKWIVSASDDYSILMHDWTTGNVVQSIINAHNIFLDASPYSVCHISPNWIASGGWSDSIIKIWHIHEKFCINQLAGHNDSITCLEKLTEQLIISGSCDNDLRVWNLYIGQCIKILKGHTKTILNIRKRNASQVVSSSKDGSIRIWDYNKGVQVHKIQAHDLAHCYFAMFSPDCFITGGYHDRNIRIWNIFNKNNEFSHSLAHEEKVDDNITCICPIDTQNVIISGERGYVKAIHFSDKVFQLGSIPELPEGEEFQSKLAYKDKQLQEKQYLLDQQNKKVQAQQQELEQKQQKILKLEQMVNQFSESFASSNNNN